MADVNDPDAKKAVERLDKEVWILSQTAQKRGDELDEEYADKVMRSQLQEIANLTELLSERVGSGETISVTDPSELE